MKKWIALLLTGAMITCAVIPVFAEEAKEETATEEAAPEEAKEEAAAEEAAPEEAKEETAAEETASEEAAAEEAIEEIAEETAAEEAIAQGEANEMTWSDIEPLLKEAEIEGDFVTFDDVAIKMWMPAVMEQVALTDEDKEAGFIDYYQTPDGENIVSVTYLNADGMDLEAFAKLLEDDETISDIEFGALNGMETLTYFITDENADFPSRLCVTFSTKAGYLLEIVFAPITPEFDTDYAGIASIILTSIQPEE